MLLIRLAQLFKKEKISYAVAGGLAVNFYGATRGTIDIDLVVSFKAQDLMKVQLSLESLGLQSRLPLLAKEVAEFRQEYINKRNMIAWSFVNPKNPTEVVDLLLTQDFSEFDVEWLSLLGERIPLVSLADLISMKKKSGRPQDLEDVKALMRIQNEKKK